MSVIDGHENSSAWVWQGALTLSGASAMSGQSASPAMCNETGLTESASDWATISLGELDPEDFEWPLHHVASIRTLEKLEVRYL